MQDFKWMLNPQSWAHTRWKPLFCFVQVLLIYDFWHMRPRTITIKLGGPLKSIKKKIEIDFYVIIGFQLYCKDIHDHALNQIVYYFDFIHVRSFHTTTYNKSLRLWEFEVRNLDSLLWSGLDAKFDRPWNIIQCKFPCFHPLKLPWFLKPLSSTSCNVTWDKLSPLH